MRIRRSIIVASFVLLGIAPAFAFDPATDHTCVAYCGGGSAPSGGGGGGYVAPAPRGPSPAELAKQRQRAQALQLDTRAHAAFDRGDTTEAARLFEQAAQLAPNDSNIQGNRWYTKGMVAAAQGDYESAVAYYRKALRYFPDNKEIAFNLQTAEEKSAADRQDWSGAEKVLGQDSETKHYYLGRQAIDEKNWDKAIHELKEFQPIIEARIAHGRKAVSLFTQAQRAYLDAHASKEVAANRRNLVKAKKQLSENEELSIETNRYLKIALAGQHAGAQRKADEQRREQASNPNYPKPPPVYRDASTPRSYPDLGYYTPAQHDAHKANDEGNSDAQRGDWVHALLDYQQALTEDPEGPFSQVIKDNLAIAMSHLGPQKTKTAPAAAAVIPAAAPPTPPQEKPKDIVQSNCTGWMTANGTSSRLCMDAQSHRYCEQSAQADGKGAVSRVACQ